MLRRHSIPSHTFFKLLGLSLGSLVPLALLGQPAPGFVAETDLEFQTLADVDGDGRPDLVVVDKTTGQFRIAHGSGDGFVSWRDHPGDSGLGEVNGFSAGPIVAPDRDSLLFTDPLANRIQLVDTPSDQRLTEPVRLPALFVGPAFVTAINLPAGAPGYDSDFFDVIYHSTLHDADASNVVSSLRNAGGGPPFEEFGEFVEPNPVDRPNRIVIESGQDEVYGALERLPSESGFHLYDPSASPISRFTGITGLPGDAAYVYADFNGDNGAQFVFFTPGSNTLFESEWDGAQLTKPSSFSYPETIDDIRVIASAGQPELLIIYNDGADADRVKYDSGGNIVQQETLSLADGETITGALSVGDKLHLLTGSDGRSASTSTYEFDGNKHALRDEQKLTPLKTSHGSSVLLFDAPPLTEPDARLLSRLDAGPWTSAFSLNGSDAEVVSELYRGPAEGLGNHETIVLKNTPAATQGGLTNQPDADFSLRFDEAPVGEMTAQVSIEPDSGTYSRAIRPTLSVNGDPSDIFYRTTQEPDWTRTTNLPVITTDTVLHVVAVIDSNTYSNIAKAEYAFTQEPGKQDSNGNGLPDFVAEAHGLDPLAETFDADGDGFTDFQEVLAGTNPTDSADKPNREEATFEYPNAFDLVAAPAIPDPGAGSTPLRSFADGGSARPTKLKVHQPNGFYLGGAETGDTPHLSSPAASFNALGIAHSDLFLLATTESNFPVNDGTAKDYGRQVAAIVSIPEQDFEPFSYEGFGENGGHDDLATEAQAWRAAALTYYENLQRETVVADAVGPESTLGLLLVEKILGDQLHNRDLVDRTNISLTPFRQNENPLAPTDTEETISARDRSVALADLLALQRDSGDSAPSFKINEIVTTVQDAVATASGTNIQQLIELAERLYTTSATNADPASLRQPLSALRHFIRTGNLDNTGYDDAPAASNFPSSLLSDAATGVGEIEALVSPRSVETIAIYYDGSPIDSNCHTWKEVVFDSQSFDPDNPTTFGTEYALVDEQGEPFPIARAIPLTAGSVFEVTGFVEDETPCGDQALEVIPQPELVFLRNASPEDMDGDLIPDNVQDLFAGTTLSPFEDSDGNGYSDLQEILSGSDPTDPKSVPMKNGAPAPVADLSPPKVNIQPGNGESSAISFDFPQEFLQYIDFELYSSDDLQQFDPTGLRATHTSGGRHELQLSHSGDAEFYIFRMSLK